MNSRLAVCAGRDVLANLLYLLRTRAPLAAMAGYLCTVLGWRGRKRFHARREAYRQNMASRRYTHDWFSGNIPYWLGLIEKHKLAARPTEVLEIGSWEGNSSYFILEQLPNATLTCVDTWAGADEHKAMSMVSTIEETFDRNLAPFEKRLVKFKGTSQQFFGTLPKDKRYDVIYVDGSHHCDDVMMDALSALRHLRKGGIIIFDDYMWRIYKDWRNNPAPALNSFLRLKKQQIALETVYYQLAISKHSEDGYETV